MSGAGDGLSRRELIGAGAGAAVALGSAGIARAAGERVVARIDFAAAEPGAGWSRGWRSVGVATLRTVAGEGLLEAGSDVFPNDPRPVAFARDARVRDGEVSAELTRAGSATGVVLRRVAADAFYAAIYDPGLGALRIMRRDGADLVELARTPVPLGTGVPLTLSLAASGAGPASLRASISAGGEVRSTVTANDASPRLARAGDAGVLATAETLFPSDRNPVLPALGNLHLLPWSVQEGQAVMATPVGDLVIGEIALRSTAGFRSITVRSTERPRAKRAAVVAATTGIPVAGGARLQVATDEAAGVSIELSESTRFHNPAVIRAGRTDRFLACSHTVRGLAPGRRFWWRPVLERRGTRIRGPVRSFRVLPEGGGGARLAVASCGSQFGPIFDLIAADEPDVFVWHGDLNYPDTHGPLAQSIDGYAGIWRDFLANPLLRPIIDRAAFATQRDDHDYGVQDANSTNIGEHPWGLAPWESLINPSGHYRFPAGAAEVWVLDQRRHKSDPKMPDTAEKTLLGAQQRQWLLRTLERSPARFKLICSPCTVFMGSNARDGNWGAGYTAERDLLLEHTRTRVAGTTIFLTGDVHFSGVYDSDGLFEARAAPVGIPKPNDITLVDPLAAAKLARRPGVAYAGDENHFTRIDVSGAGREARLELSMVREDGAVPYRKVFSS